MPNRWNERRRWRSLLLCALVGATGAQLTAEEPTATESPVEATLETWLAREVELGKDLPLVAPGDAFRVLVPFPVLDTPSFDEKSQQVSFSLDLGTEQPVYCVAYLDSLDPATSVVQVSEASLPVGSEDSLILGRELQAVDIATIGQEIVLSADWLYTFQQGEEKLAGMLKVRVASLGLDGVVCLHDEVGYQSSLDRIMERMVRSWRWTRQKDVRPVFVEVTGTRMNGQAYSADRQFILVDPDGDYVVRSINSTLVAVDSATLSGEEGLRVDFATPQGRLINSLVLVSDSAGIGTQLNLNPVDESTWQVVGTFQNKPLDLTIQHGSLGSELSDRQELKHFLRTAAAGDRLVQKVWAVEIDPTTISEGVIEFTGRRDGLASTRIIVGEITFDAEIDDQGSLVRGGVDLAGTRMEVARVHMDGVFPDAPPSQ